MPREAVLDASAVLALLNAEPGVERVADCVPTASISAVNVAEVVGKLVDVGMPPEVAWEAISALGLAVVPLDAADAVATGALRGRTRDRGLSLGDRACLALAARLGLPAVTADRAWNEVHVGVAIDQIR